MPVRQLDLFLNSQSTLAQSQPIQNLSGIRVAVDGAFWLRKFLQNRKSELCSQWNGAGAVLISDWLKEELNLFKAQGIHAFFVFNGIPPQPIRAERPFSQLDRRPAARDAAWQAKSEFERNQQWTSAGLPSVVDLVPMLLGVLESLGIEFLRAPYGALAQLAYMDRSARGYFHLVYGGSDYLLYDVDRTILNIDFKAGTFTLLERRRFLASLQLHHDQFLDVCLLAGCDYIPTFPPLLDSSITPAGFSYQTALEMIRVYGTGAMAVQQFSEHPGVVQSGFMDAFARARALIRHQPVWTDQCTLEPLHPTMAPNDLHALFGPRLPSALVFFLTQGLLSPQLLHAFVSKRWVDPVPLCNGREERVKSVFRGFLKQDRAVLLRVLETLVGVQHQTARVPVTWTPWYSPSEDIPLVLGGEKIEWEYALALSPPAIDESARSTVVGIWKTLESFSPSDPPKRATHHVSRLQSLPEFQYASYVMVLAHHQFVDLKKRKLTPLGLQLLNYTSKWAEKNSNEVKHLDLRLETLVQVISLKQAGFFDATVDAKELLTQLACFFPAEFKSVASFKHGYDRSLLSTHTVQKAVNQTFRQNLELAAAFVSLKRLAVDTTSDDPEASQFNSRVTAVMELLLEWLQPDITKRTSERGTEWTLGLGFLQETSTFPGILLKSLLEKKTRVMDYSDCLTEPQIWFRELLVSLEFVTGFYQDVSIWQKARELIKQL